MRVFWIEQAERNVPADTNWLSSVEGAHLSALQIPKRKAEWRLGRWTAKSAVISYLGLPSNLIDFAAVEIRASDSGAPEVYWYDKAVPVLISLSHRDGTAVCGIGPRDARFGCDLELVEHRDPVFVSDYFTDEEQQLVQQVPQQCQSRVVTLIWSAKESALKALRTGLRLDTRSVALQINRDLMACALNDGDTMDWTSLAVRGPGGEPFSGWCQFARQFVKTLVSAVPVECPTTLCASRLDEPAEQGLSTRAGIDTTVRLSRLPFGRRSNHDLDSSAA